MEPPQEIPIGVPIYRPFDDVNLAHSITTSIFQILSVLLAVLNVCVFWNSRALRHGPARWHNWIVVHTNLGDFLMNIFSVVSQLDMLRAQAWNHSDTWCQFQGFTTLVGAFISINGVVLLTQERTTTILMAKEWGAKQTIFGLTSSTVFSIVTTSLFFYDGNRLALQESGLYCCPDWGGQVLRPQPHPTLNRYLGSIIFSLVVLAIIGIFGSYLSIWLIVRRANRKLTHWQRTPTVTLDQSDTEIPAGLKASGSESKLPNVEAPNPQKSFSVGDPIRSVQMDSMLDCSDPISSRRPNVTIEPSAHNPQPRPRNMENEIATKCCVMVFSVMLLWLPHTIKMAWTISTTGPVPKIYDAYSATISICPGFINPLINFFMDSQWKDGAYELFRDISVCWRNFRKRRLSSGAGKTPKEPRSPPPK
ncbi:hypothetical protein DFJ77DRAFT_169987 [Powellomyces hirtus]|nr:hypothetical protein DFJ77DRAFT_169987 [Powellomyces hirtus]